MNQHSLLNPPPPPVPYCELGVPTHPALNMVHSPPKMPTLATPINDFAQTDEEAHNFICKNIYICVCLYISNIKDSTNYINICIVEMINRVYATWNSVRIRKEVYNGDAWSSSQGLKYPELSGKRVLERTWFDYICHKDDNIQWWILQVLLCLELVCHIKGSHCIFFPMSSFLAIVLLSLAYSVLSSIQYC